MRETLASDRPTMCASVLFEMPSRPAARSAAFVTTAPSETTARAAARGIPTPFPLKEYMLILACEQPGPAGRLRGPPPRQSPHDRSQHADALANVPFGETGVTEEQTRPARRLQVVRLDSVDPDSVLGHTVADGVELRGLHAAEPDDDVHAGVGADDLHAIAEVLLE